jgi:hypothetical protein
MGESIGYRAPVTTPESVSRPARNKEEPSSIVGHQSFHCCWTLMLLMFASGGSNLGSMVGPASRARRNDITA